PRPRLHLMFAARLPALMLRRLKLLFFRHNTSVCRELRYTISGGASVCAPLSSRRRSAIAQSVASLRASRASITLSARLTDGSPVSAHASLRVNVLPMASCGGRPALLRDHDGPDVSFVLYRAWE